MLVLYSQPGCGQCKMIHTLLDSKKIKYEECQDEATMKSKGVEHTPSIEVDGKILKGKEMFNFINGVK